MNESFREELERWARRPPERPASVARGRVLACLESRPAAGLSWKIPMPLWFLAGLALALALGFHRTEIRPASLETPAQSLVVFQLQSGTKVYFALPPEGTLKGDRL